jgi:hypothetical protein
MVAQRVVGVAMVVRQLLLLLLEVMEMPLWVWALPWWNSRPVEMLLLVEEKEEKAKGVVAKKLKKKKEEEEAVEAL